MTCRVVAVYYVQDKTLDVVRAVVSKINL
jgi:hypothetical protein